MKEKKVYNVEQEANEEKIDFQEILFKYLIHWPWFVGTVVVFLLGAWLYSVSYTHLTLPTIA